MAKTKCVLCKLYNCINECKKHFNPTTALNVKLLSNMIADKDNPNHAKAIESFCEKHRNPLKLNVTLSWCFDEITTLGKYGDKAKLVDLIANQNRI